MQSALVSKNSKYKIPRVVVIGGGTGSFVVLSALKNYPFNISAVITMMDSGGSTGRLRDQLGVLPPGDLRQALVALSDSEKIWRDLFTYRFEEGDLKGHNFGNIFISALEKITGSMSNAIDLASYILDAKGHVIPVTNEDAQLCAVLEDGTTIEGETAIDEPKKKRPPIINAYLKPQAFPNPRALSVLKQADFIVLGPGDVYTSIVPNLLVSDIQQAIRRSGAKKIYIANLMTKMGQTDNLTAKGHLDIIEQYLGSNIDYVLINSKKPSGKLLAWYSSEGGVTPVKDDLNGGERYNVIRNDFLSTSQYKKSEVDAVTRSLIRHDPLKVAAAIESIIDSELF